jgi:hypothetical protein
VTKLRECAGSGQLRSVMEEHQEAGKERKVKTGCETAAAGGVVQVIEHLPSKPEAMGSSTSTTKKEQPKFPRWQHGSSGRAPA